MTEVRVENGQPICPSCGGSNLAHVYTVRRQGYLAVDDNGNIFGTGHDDDECSNWLVRCHDCYWTEYETDIEDREEVDL